jgi:hypothetical protein
MGFDIRFPLGCVFVVVGAILTVYGVSTWNSVIYTVSMGININFLWGALMLGFGGITLATAEKG